MTTSSEMDIEEEEVQEGNIVREEYRKLDEEDLWVKHKTTPVIEESRRRWQGGYQWATGKAGNRKHDRNGNWLETEKWEFAQKAAPAETTYIGLPIIFKNRTRN